MRFLRLIFFLLFTACAFFLFYTFFQKSPLLKIKKRSSVVPKIISQAPKPTEIVERSLFIPYWSLDNEMIDPTYTRLIYFGVVGGMNGLVLGNKEEENLTKFQKMVDSKKTLLTVRMTNSSTNLAVLEDKDAQNAIIKDTLDTAKKYGFSGIVLDLEISGLFADQVPGQINAFVENFYNRAHAAKISLAMTLYGDVFYRKRPYDVPFLSKHTDEVMIMAYDFHKSTGEPGPNFPFLGRDKYGYDFQTMIQEYKDRVPSEKLTVLYGMYGYDWIVDEKRRPFRQAQAVTDAQVKEKYLDTCGKTNCVPFRDKDAKEQEIDYVDNLSQYHIIWFEDGESVRVKTEFLKENGIGSMGYWAYGYF